MAMKKMVKEDGNLVDNVVKPIDEYLKNKDPKLQEYVKKMGLSATNKDDMALLEKAMAGDSASEDSLCQKAGCTGVVEAGEGEDTDGDAGTISDLDIDPTEDAPAEGDPMGEPDGTENPEENPEELDYNDENVTALDIIKSMTQKILSAMGEDAESLENELNPEGGENPEGEPEGGETPDGDLPTDLDTIPDNSETPDDENR